MKYATKSYTQSLKSRPLLFALKEFEAIPGVDVVKIELQQYNFIEFQLKINGIKQLTQPIDCTARQRIGVRFVDI